MHTSLKGVAVTSLLLPLLLVACGGDSGNMDVMPTPKLLPTVYTSEGRILSSCSLIPACSGIPTAPFFANALMAPAHGATVRGIVRLEVSGNDMANVELLPYNAYAPKLGIFNITGDKTRAWLDLDTTRLPDGPIAVRVSAFNRPAGDAGATEITAMSARVWNVANAGFPPPAALSASATSVPLAGGVLTGITRLELQGSGIVNAELLPASGYAPKLGTFNISADRTRAWLDLDSRSLADGVRNVRISAFSTTEGQPGASEVIAMPARSWEWRNGSTGAFTASVTMTPPQDALVGGFLRLEVRGSGIRNVELLPANGYSPRLGVFSVSGDRSFAWLDLDTTKLPNGVLEARISAFDVPAGEAGAKEIVAMPVHQWRVQN